jgi:hypothetical protein
MTCDPTGTAPPRPLSMPHAPSGESGLVSALLPPLCHPPTVGDAHNIVSPLTGGKYIDDCTCVIAVFNDADALQGDEVASSSRS